MADTNAPPENNQVVANRKRTQARQQMIHGAAQTRLRREQINGRREAVGQPVCRRRIVPRDVNPNLDRVQFGMIAACRLRHLRRWPFARRARRALFA